MKQHQHLLRKQHHERLFEAQQQRDVPGLFRFPMDTARAEAEEERREVNRGIGEQFQGAVVQEEFLGGNTGRCYVLGEKLGFHNKLLI